MAPARITGLGLFACTVPDSYAYVAADSFGLQVIDITDPASPGLVSVVDTPGAALDVTVRGNYAYVADADYGLQVIEIADPAACRVVSGLMMRGSAKSVAISGNYAYVAGDFLGLQVVDLTNPEYPQLKAGFEGERFNGVAVFSGYAYVTPVPPPEASSSNLLVAPLQCDDSDQQVTIDIKPGSDPNSINCKGNPGVIPVAILTTDTFDALTVDHTTVRFGPGEASELHVRKNPKPHGNGKVSARPDSGAPRRHEEDVDHDGDIDLVFHFARAETGIVCGDTEAVLTGQTYDGQSIFGSDTLQTVPDGDVEPEPVRMLQISPNPFNPATSIEFVVAEPKHVNVRVYDVRGQLVAKLADGAYPAGRHLLEWHGRDTAGHTVSSGLYFFRVDMGGQVEVRKALLIK